MKLAHLITTVALVALGATGCSNDASTTSPPTLSADLVGTWDYETVTVNNQPVVPITQAFEAGNSMSASMTLGADFSYVYNEWDGSGVVTWNERGRLGITGQSFAIRVIEENSTPIPLNITTGVWDLTDGVLSTTLEDAPNTITITYSKQ